MEIYGLFFGVSVLLDLLIAGIFIVYLFKRTRNPDLAATLKSTNLVLAGVVLLIAIILEVGFYSADVFDHIFTLIPLGVAVMIVSIQYLVKQPK